MVLREFPKESQALLGHLGHLDQRDLQDLLGLQGMGCQDLQDGLDLLVHREFQELGNQVFLGFLENLEELVLLALKEKWALGVKKDHQDSQGLKDPQDHLDFQE